MSIIPSWNLCFAIPRIASSINFVFLFKMQFSNTFFKSVALQYLIAICNPKPFLCLLKMHPSFPPHMLVAFLFIYSSIQAIFFDEPSFASSFLFVLLKEIIPCNLRYTFKLKGYLMCGYLPKFLHLNDCIFT